MGRQQVTLGMLNSILELRFELVIYDGKSEDLRHVVVTGPKSKGMRNEIGRLCEAIGLDKETEVGSVYQSVEKDGRVAVYVSVDAETCERIGQMVLDGEIEGRVSLHWRKGGGGDAAGTV